MVTESKTELQFDAGAKSMLQLLDEGPLDAVLGDLFDQIGTERIITQDDVLKTLKCHIANVRSGLRLIKSNLRFSVEIESEGVRDAAGRQKRTVDDLIAGIKKSAFCMQLGSELFDS